MRGILTWAEGVEELGLRGMRWQVRLGTLVSRYRGVYAAPGNLGPWLNELEAVVKWAGSNALASHRSAAFLHSLDLLERCEFEVTVGRKQHPNPVLVPGRERVIVHRSNVPQAERTQVSGIACTSLLWTCLDLAGTFERVALAVAIESAWRKRRWKFVELLRELVRKCGNGKRGIRGLEAILIDCAGRGKPMRSSFEVELWHYLLGRRGEIELPVPGHPVHDAAGNLEIDFAWVRQKVAIETNGWGVHGTWKAFNADADRSSRLLALGWRILPVTYRMFSKAPDAVFERIRSTLALAESTRAVGASGSSPQWRP